MSDQANISFSDEESCPTLNLQVFVCSVCGEDHETENCPLVQCLKQVHDSKILSRAKQTLPKFLDVETLADGSTTVISNALIEQGTQFGPFQSPLSIDLHPSIMFPLKVFGKSLDEGYYLDTTNEELCNWMCLVAAATNIREQNLICYDVKESIYFMTTRDVQPGEELRVWYALYYGLKLQALPLAEDSLHEDGFCDLAEDEAEGRCKSNEEASLLLGEDLLQTLAQHLPAHVLGAPGERDVWICKLCGNQESNVASYARHLMTHYRQQVNDNDHSKCVICMKRFLSKKMLQKHVLKFHKCDLISNEASLTAFSFEESQIRVLNDSESGSGRESKSEQKENSDPEKVELNSETKMKPSVDFVHVSRKSQHHRNLEDELKSENSMSSSKSFKSKSPNKSLGSKEFDASSMSGPEQPLSKTVHELENFPNSTSLSMKININCGELKHHEMLIADLSNEKTCELPSEFHTRDSREQLEIQSNNGESFPKTVNLGEAGDLDKALATREPLTFIVVESSSVNETFLSSTNENASEKTVSSNVSETSDTIFGLIPSQECSSTKLSENENLASQECSSTKLSENKNLASQECSSTKLSENENLAYKCDICQKSFGKCSYLYRHLRKHTGEFTCVTCLAVFARKENLKTHSCSQPKEWFPCPTCGKKFSAKKYLQRHALMHTREFFCSECERNFASRLSLKCHRCSRIKLETEKAMISCFMCERSFDSELKLQSHLKVHSDVNLDKSIPCKTTSICKPHTSQKLVKRKDDSNQEQSQSESSERKVFICEVCGAIFKSSSSMKTHRFLHEERKFECDICKKRFHRKDVLQEHLRVHQDANFPCSICGKKYKTKKSLYVHSLIHKGSKRFSCGVCGKEFFQKGNLFKHVQTHTSERLYTCEYCEKSFSSKEYFNIHVLTHTQGKIFQCEACKRSFVKKHLLDTHRQLYHSNRGFLCKFCNTVIRHRHSVRRHLEKTHSEHQEEWSTPGFLDTLLAELPENLLYPSGDLKLSPKQQEERQYLLESLRKTHFEDKNLRIGAPVDVVSSTVFTFAPTSTTEATQLTQVDPLVMLQSSQQLRLIDNFLPEYVQAETTLPGVEHSVLVSENVQASDGEILLALVDQDTAATSVTNATPVLTSAALGSDMIGTGRSFLMDDCSENNSVLLYVVETSNGEEGDSQDLVWC